MLIPIDIKDDYENYQGGYIDRTGALAIPFMYNRCNYFSDIGLASVSKEGRFGYIDIYNEIVIPFSFEVALPFNNNRAIVKKNQYDNNYTIINTLGEEVFSIDLNEFTITPYRFNERKQYSEDMYVTKYNNKWGFFDTEGKFTESKIQGISGKHFYQFKEGLARFCDNSNGKYGFINKDGEVVIPPLYNDAQDFSQGLSAVKLENGMWGFINKENSFVIAPEYDLVKTFKEGLAYVYRSDEDDWGNFTYREKSFINRNGKVMFSLPEDEFYFGDYSEGLVATKKLVLDTSTYSEYDKYNTYFAGVYDTSGYKQIIPTTHFHLGIVSSQCNVEFQYGLLSLEGPRGQYFISTDGNKLEYNKTLNKIEIETI